MLLALFVGGIFATLMSIPISAWGMTLLQDISMLDRMSWIYLVLKNFCVVALVEESLKYAALVVISYSHTAFVEPYDAMLYSVTVALGFATLENIFYVAQGGLQVALMRALLTVPAHALFAAAMGYHLGKAKFCADAGKTMGHKGRALLVPLMMHGFFDLLLSSRSNIIVMGVIPLSLGMWIMVLKQIKLAQSP